MPAAGELFFAAPGFSPNEELEFGDGEAGTAEGFAAELAGLGAVLEFTEGVWCNAADGGASISATKACNAARGFAVAALSLLLVDDAGGVFSAAADSLRSGWWMAGGAGIEAGTLGAGAFGAAAFCCGTFPWGEFISTLLAGDCGSFTLLLGVSESKAVAEGSRGATELETVMTAAGTSFAVSPTGRVMVAALSGETVCVGEETAPAADEFWGWSSVWTDELAVPVAAGEGMPWAVRSCALAGVAVACSGALSGVDAGDSVAGVSGTSSVVTLWLVPSEDGDATDGDTIVTWAEAKFAAASCTTTDNAASVAARTGRGVGTGDDIGVGRGTGTGN